MKLFCHQLQYALSYILLYRIFYQILYLTGLYIHEFTAQLYWVCIIQNPRENGILFVSIIQVTDFIQEHANTFSIGRSQFRTCNFKISFSFWLQAVWKFHTKIFLRIFRYNKANCLLDQRVLYFCKEWVILFKKIKTWNIFA